MLFKSRKEAFFVKTVLRAQKCFGRLDFVEVLKVHTNQHAVVYLFYLIIFIENAELEVLLFYFYAIRKKNAEHRRIT